MKIYLNTLLLALSVSVLFFSTSCDEVEKPYRTLSNRVESVDSLRTDTMNVPVRQFVLLEDFTGFKCGWCPSAGRIVDAIYVANPEAVIPIKIHVGALAEPSTEHPEDYRSDVGNALDAQYNISAGGIPKGLVNRKEYNGGMLLAKDNFRAATDVQMGKTPTAMLRTHALFDPTTRQIDVQTRIEILTTGNLKHQLAIYIVEDSIVGTQKEYSKPIPKGGYFDPYYHNHTLRGSMNGPFGEPLRSSLPTRLTSGSSDEIAAGTVGFVSYKSQAKPEWNLVNCHIIAVLTDPGTGEVIQSFKADLQPGTIK